MFRSSLTGTDLKVFRQDLLSGLNDIKYFDSRKLAGRYPAEPIREVGTRLVTALCVHPPPPPTVNFQ